MTKPARARRLGLIKQRDIVEAETDGDVRAPRHFERVAEEAEAGHIGHRVNFAHSRELRSDDIETRHEAQHLAIAVVGKRALLDRRRIDARRRAAW